LTVISNPDCAFDLTLREQALWALSLLCRGADSTIAEVSVSHGLLPRLSCVFQEQHIELQERIPGLLAIVARHCRTAVLSAVPFEIINDFIESRSIKMREDGLKLILWLCSGAIPDLPKRMQFAQCLLSIFRPGWESLLWLALLGIAFWIENSEPGFDCFGVFWGSDSNFAIEFVKFWTSPDIDLLISLFRVIAAVLKRGEMVPAMSVPVLLEKLCLPPMVVRAVVEVLGLLAERRAYAELLVGSGVMEELGEVFKSASFGLKEAIAACIASLVRYGATAMRMAVIEKGGIEMMIACLASDKDGLVFELLSAIGELREAGKRWDGTNAFLDRFEEQGGWEKIEGFVEHSCESVAHLATEMLQFRGGGYEPPSVYCF
jgi:hypothetical protein